MNRLQSRQQAVVFDLFGTIVPIFSYSAHERLLEKMADILKVRPDRFRELWVGTYSERVVGRFPDTRSNLLFVLEALGHSPSEGRITSAVSCFKEFTRQSLRPIRGALRVLTELRQRGFRTGLLSNCSPEAADLWPETAFASLFDAAIFSCRIGLAKPALETYRSVSGALAVPPTACIFVGDGSNQELEGAARAGMHPVLAQTEFQDAYDSSRPEVARWSGRTIVDLSDLLELCRSVEGSGAPTVKGDRETAPRREFQE